MEQYPGILRGGHSDLDNPTFLRQMARDIEKVLALLTDPTQAPKASTCARCGGEYKAPGGYTQCCKYPTLAAEAPPPAPAAREGTAGVFGHTSEFDSPATTGTVTLRTSTITDDELEQAERDLTLGDA